jgi:hypothetical protein
MSVNDTSTTQPPGTGAGDPDGHGRHRGPVSARDTDVAPSGRHRKPSERTAA